MDALHPKTENKKAIVIRYGAIGDHIIISPIFRILKEDGYHVTFHSNTMGINILRLNPYIDKFIKHDTSIPADDRLTEFWEKLYRDYDKIINFSESIEGTLSKVEYREDFFLSDKERRSKCNVNFYDHSMAWAGYPDKTGLKGELHFSNIELRLAREFRRKHKNHFLVMWVMSGSSPHKAYPFSGMVARNIIDRHKDVHFFTVGDEMSQLLEWQYERTRNYSGIWPIRKTLAMTQFFDLVISPDTGVMHGAGCYDVEKILLLSSTTEENLAKNWKNCQSIGADVPCRPCHRLHYSMKHCIPDERTNTPVCMTKLQPKKVIETIEKIYYSRR